MTDDKKRTQSHDDERTATDELAAAFRNGARIASVNRPSESEPTGLPRGMHDSDKSPVAPK
jgi:hypothetical protein